MTFIASRTEGSSEDIEAALGPPPWSVLEWSVIAVIAIPFVIGIIALLGGSDANFRSVGDNALNELRMRDFGHHTLLLGPYSRDGWSHPGPALYYLFAIPYRIFGSRSSAFSACALTLNGAAVVSMIVIARRTSGRLMMLLVAAAVAIITMNLGWEVLRNPWNPYVTILPFGLLFLSCWALACGHRWHLPLAAAVATFCVQTHIVYLPVAAALVTWGGVGALVTHRRDRRRREGATWGIGALVATVAILAVMWAPPIIDQITGTGNLNTIRVYFQTHSDTRGLGDAFRVVGEEFTLSPDWVTGSEPPLIISGEPQSLLRTPIPLLGLVWFAIGALAWRRQRTDVRQFAIGAVVLTGAAFAAVAQTTGTLYDYRLRMLWIAGAFTAVAAVGLAARRWLFQPGAQRALTTVLVVTVLFAGTVATSDATTGRPPDRAYVQRVPSFGQHMISKLRSGHGVLLLRSASLAASLYTGAVAIELEQAGLPIRFDAFKVTELTLGAHRLYRSGPIRGVITIAVDASVDSLRTQPHQRLIASWSQESTRRRMRDLTELRRISVKAGARDHSTAATLTRVTELLRRTATVGIFFSRTRPADSVPPAR